MEYYTLIKDYARHEDELMNQRITWCLLVSSFMFASLALVVAESASLRNLVLFEIFAVDIPLLQSAVMAISLSGLLMTLGSIKGISAAADALESLHGYWLRAQQRYEDWDNFPAILGGGVHRAHVRGLEYPYGLLTMLIGIWAAILLVSTYALATDAVFFRSVYQLWTGEAAPLP